MSEDAAVNSVICVASIKALLTNPAAKRKIRIQRKLEIYTFTQNTNWG